MLKEYKDNLINLDLKSILEEYTINDFRDLKKSFPEDYFLLAEQIKLYPKAKEKLPVLAGKYCFFTTKSYEQCSSEKLADFKANLFKGNLMLDLTGGLGVDDIAFAKSFRRVISVDNDSVLNNIARTNFIKLELKNIERIDADSNEYIKQDVKADLIYIDADRRLNNRKSIRLEDSEPNVFKILDRLWKISGNVLLKLSPLADITYISKSLPYLRNITVVSLENEVKEILVLLDVLFSGKITVKAVDISNKGTEEFSAEIENNYLPEISGTGKHFYEPANCLIKAGLVNNYASIKKINAISKNCVYLMTDNPVEDFFGKSFRVIHQMLFSKSSVQKYIKKNNISSANIAKRNFPVSTDELRKAFRIKDGGFDFLFFTADNDRNKLFFHCRKK